VELARPAELTERLASLLGTEAGDLERMVGGASRETWAFTADGQELVARCDPAGAPRSGAMALEARLLRTVAAAGVPVPEVVASADDLIVVRRLHGEALARRILRDETFAKARKRLTAQCGEALARLHTGVTPADVPDVPVDADPVATLRDTLDRLGEPHPALELGLLRLGRTRPAPAGPAVVHGDFRLGNLMVDADGLAGVLDWELTHVGDPAEDLGWLCVPSWRFGGAHPVAGVGTREELLASYAAAGGTAIDEATLRWWEAFGTLRWGVICVQQAASHLTGAVRSVELAAIGRRTCEVELDLFDELNELIMGLPAGHAGVSDAQPHDHRSGVGLHDRPTAGELVEAVRGWIEGLALQGHDAFLARVSARALQIVERELATPELEQRHRERLDSLGVADNVELAAQVRAGRDDDATVTAIHESVVDKLRVADPRLLQR
jgi:aminoglycoside phosphotransferase (APT) family kinase protein